MTDSGNNYVPRGSYAHIEKGLPNNYSSILNKKETQIAIGKLKQFIEDSLCEQLNLFRVESPLICDTNSGMTENVVPDGSRIPVYFKIDNNHIDPLDVEVTQASTKWKRWALKQFDCQIGEGILADMRAIRKDEFITNYHNSYVDQWDWEKVITNEDRNLEYLTETVKSIWKVIVNADKYIRNEFPILDDTSFPEIPKEIQFLHSEDLLDRYPDKSADERENEILKEMPAIFIYGIGYPLENGLPHGLRTGDYDDWITQTVSADGRPTRGLNGDILVWNPVTNQKHELSSMAIRVTKEALIQQLDLLGQMNLIEKPYHQMIINDEVPLCIGGGIGESRTYMYLLRKAALGECHPSVWPDTFMRICQKKNIPLLK